VRVIIPLKEGLVGRGRGRRLERDRVEIVRRVESGRLERRVVRERGGGRGKEGGGGVGDGVKEEGEEEEEEEEEDLSILDLTYINMCCSVPL